MVLSLGQPLVRSDVERARGAPSGVEVSVRVARLADDAGIVSAGGQHEGQVGVVE